jgi:cell division protein FtsB
VRAAGGQVVTAALLLGIAGVTLSALFGEHGLLHLRRLDAERRSLHQRTFALLDANARLREEIRRLESDDLHLEELARRRLGLVRPNETVYRFRRRP